MPITLDEVRRQLSAIEPDESIYTGLGSSEIPLLQQLLSDPEPWMSARAIFALSRIVDNNAVEVIRNAISDPRPEVRVAIAASAVNLAVTDSNVILAKVLEDQDIGVRKFAVASISTENDPSIHTRLQTIESQDPSSLIREHARLKRRELENRPSTPPSKINPLMRPKPGKKK